MTNSCFNDSVSKLGMLQVLQRKEVKSKASAQDNENEGIKLNPYNIACIPMGFQS